MDNTNKPNIRGYIGSTGSGKGVSVRALLKAERPARLLIWDPLNEYGAFCKVRTSDPVAMARAVNDTGAPFSVAFFPGKDVRTYERPFEQFCRVAWSAGRCTVLVEELADVTTASYAPPLWSSLTRRGRHRGLSLIACTQRPAKIDKDFLGNATYVRCFTMRFQDDQRALAAVLGVPLADVAALKTTEGEKATVIEYIERDFRGGSSQKGSIRLPRR